MPVTRGRARKMEKSQEYIEEEPSQQLQEPEEQETTPTEESAVDLQQILSQPSVRAQVQFATLQVSLESDPCDALCERSELEDDAAMIQAGVDELYRMQEVHIVGRLKNASSTILTFGDANQEVHSDHPASEGGDNEDEATE
ncbi:hypothetical protein BBO99_00004737 [Phytophthora kernoviae]|uniref:Uncharacterized protein n=1 Tax=Phytophthora kernoviae TaxID=325452 RepID=A0A3R7JZL0_9STRA|nr:hypothetical protein JM16_001829 [Phytophthora kernoviae]KAG2530409.1 hypothetical protein JM18_002254 [Phytophthora kernoviae]RLN27066.1 hypothetical protein BBI17_002506 [Phytophthora kernoviae]RLN80129.1 hypothetical protein BBO99_00004737 [Phytophthora kernoviae]